MKRIVLQLFIFKSTKRFSIISYNFKRKHIRSIYKCISTNKVKTHSAKNTFFESFQNYQMKAEVVFNENRKWLYGLTGSLRTMD